MLTYIKLSKADVSKITQSGGFPGVLSSNLAGPLMKVAVSLAKNVLEPSATMASASAIYDAIQRKLRGKDFVRARKEITLVILNEYMDEIIRTIKSLENSVV